MELLFDNPRFHQGLNVTVRLGTKWAFNVRVGDTVNLARASGGSVIQTAIIQGIVMCKLDELPEALLALEHDPSCRTREGLRDELARVYKLDINDDAWVVALIFNPREPS